VTAAAATAASTMTLA